MAAIVLNLDILDFLGCSFTECGDCQLPFDEEILLFSDYQTNFYSPYILFLKQNKLIAKTARVTKRFAI
jgi:hypothetical protein